MIVEIVKTLFKLKFSRSQIFSHGLRLPFKVMPWHIDLNMHINNANYLVFMERGRWDYFARTKAAKDMIKQRVNLIVAGVEIGYYRELRLWQKFELLTTPVAYDDKYLYIEQRFVRGDKICATALVKVVFVKAGKTVNPATVWQKLNINWQQPPLPPSISSWQQLSKDKRKTSAN